MTNKHVLEAEEVLQKIARCNGVKVQGQLLTGSKDELLQDIKNEENEVCKDREHDMWAARYKGPGKETIRDLFADRVLLKHLIISMGHW